MCTLYLCSQDVEEGEEGRGGRAGGEERKEGGEWHGPTQALWEDGVGARGWRLRAEALPQDHLQRRWRRRTAQELSGFGLHAAWPARVCGPQAGHETGEEGERGSKFGKLLLFSKNA